MRILVVEDAAAVGASLAALLASWKMESVLATDAEAALAARGEHDIDLVLADLRLPGPSGIDLVQKMRNDEAHADLPVLMIPGQASRHDILIASTIGQILYPFPRTSTYPLSRALDDGDWDTATPFLPAGLLQSPLLGADELVELVRTVSPRVRHFTEELRHSLD